MNYTITEQGILFHIEDEEADRQAAQHIDTVGCAFGSVVVIPPEPPAIPDGEAVEKCKQVADENRVALEKVQDEW